MTMKRKTKRLYKWGTTIALLTLLGVWVTSRWDVWFHNPEELPYVSDAMPHRLLLTMGNDGHLSRNVSWQADSAVHHAWLELVDTATADTVRIVAEGEVFTSRAGRAAYYVARIPRLNAATTYSYRAVTNGLASPWHHFATQATPTDSLHFLYVGDIQDTIGGQANRFLREAVNRHPLTELLVCGGDLTERPRDEDWAESFRAIDSVAQTVPMLCVTGNHDYLKGVVMRLERRFSLVFSYFLRSMMGDNQVYTVTYGPAQFFLLDSNRELPFLMQQRLWLKAQLEVSQARWKIVVLHHPLFSIKGGMNNILQRWVFNSLIEEHGVDLVLQGHEHAYARMTRHDDNRAVTPVYTVSHCSPKNYRIEFDDDFDKYGISSRYYQTIDIKGDTLALAAYEVYGHTLYDSLLIIKRNGLTTIEDHGAAIPEYMEYTPEPGSKKDRDYAQRIADYKLRHPERMGGTARTHHDASQQR